MKFKRTKLLCFFGIVFFVLFTAMFKYSVYASESRAPSPWAAEYIYRAEALGLIIGNAGGGYTKVLTQREFYSLASRIYEAVKTGKITAGKSFGITGNTNSLYTGAADFINAGGNPFPDSKMSREDAAVILWCLMDEAGWQTPAHSAAFNDADKISPWAASAVGRLQSVGILGSTGGNMFSPKGNFTFEQGIAALIRIYDLFPVTVSAAGQPTPLGVPAISGENREYAFEEWDPAVRTYMGKVIELANIERAKFGAAPLAMSERMNSGAMTRVGELETRFSHERPDGRDCFTLFEDFDISGDLFGENAGLGYKTPERVVADWMTSSGHRDNILNPAFTNAGVGFCTGKNGTPYWIMLFAG